MKAGSTDATPDQPSSFWSRMRDDLRHQFLLYISICKSCNAHQGFHDIFLISEAWTYVNYEAQTAEIRHWMHPKWHCTLRRIGPAGNSGEMSIEFNDKSKNLFRSIQIQSSRASREPGFPSYQVGKASPWHFLLGRTENPGGLWPTRTGSGHVGHNWKNKTLYYCYCMNLFYCINLASVCFIVLFILLFSNPFWATFLFFYNDLVQSRTSCQSCKLKFSLHFQLHWLLKIKLEMKY